MNLPRSSYYYKPVEPKDEDQGLILRIEQLVEEFSGYVRGSALAYWLFWVWSRTKLGD